MVYDKIGDEMLKAGFQRSGVQCREKIKKIQGDYKKVKDKRPIRCTGEGLYPIWNYFDAIDAILGNKHATEPPVLVNSLKDPVPRAVPKSDQNSPDSPGPFDQTDKNCAVQSTLEPSTTAVSPTKKAGTEVAPLSPIRGRIIN